MGPKSGKKKGDKGSAKVKKTRTTTQPKEDELVGLRSRAVFLESQISTTLKANENYRDSLKKLADENQALRGLTIQVQKDEVTNRAEWIKMEQTYQFRIRELSDRCKIEQKEHEEVLIAVKKRAADDNTQLRKAVLDQDTRIKLLHHELHSLKDFMNNRDALQKRVDELREAMMAATREHEEMVYLMDRKCCHDKLMLQKTAAKQIDSVTRVAYSKAIQNLRTVTSSVYEENLTLTQLAKQLLAEHQSRESAMEKATQAYKQERYRSQTQTDLLARNLSSLRAKDQTILELQERCRCLDEEAKSLIEDKRREREAMMRRMMDERAHWKFKMSQVKQELYLCGRNMARQTPESGIYTSRERAKDDNTVREFLLCALKHVRTHANEIRKIERREEREQYTRGMIQAMRGKGSWPEVKPGHLGQLARESANVELEYRLTRSMTTLHEAAAPEAPPLDWSDLTWDEKELVLRCLFVLMNQSDQDRRHGVPCIQCGRYHAGRGPCPYAIIRTEETTVQQPEKKKKKKKGSRKGPTTGTDSDGKDEAPGRIRCLK